ncbi:MAG TPA: hypothetical protein VFS71_07700 [Flavobacterium sp.]|uniref:hypothetical protein n=1 Tax=Flavobacterium sp. TaxID=239 RepID=UPI002DB92A45|nr:hypothetical protein [Flavobacterium sp.]HEU4789550.1 hypothetical protein [Flavobacterium sp.]
MKKNIFLIAIFFNLGCSIPEKKVTMIFVQRVDLEITTITRIDCDMFEHTFENDKEFKNYVIKEKTVLDKVKNILDTIKLSNKGYDIDVREKIIIFYSDSTKDTLCTSLTGLKLNGNLMEIDNKSLDFIHKL